MNLNNVIKDYNNNDNVKIIEYFYSNIKLLLDITNKFKKNISTVDNINTDLSYIIIPLHQTKFDIFVKKKYNHDDIKFIIIFRLLILNIMEKLKHESLNEQDEFKDPITKISFSLLIGDNAVNNKLFFLYLIVYDIETYIRNIIFNDKTNKKSFVGIDFEFNQRKIALMQICFETIPDKNIETINYIWLINPGLFIQQEINIMNDLLMLNNNIYKIFHGPDSLDIPYMYQYLFNNDQNKIVQFTSKLFDTRFLCEYYKLSINQDRNCSIYDALFYFDTIDKNKRDDLEKVHEDMGPVQDVSWNIHKMSSFHIKYALYDVLFLNKYLTNIFNCVSKNTPDKKFTYKYIVPLIRFIFLERREVTNITEYCKNKINPVNNYLIKYHNSNHTLINLYSDIISDFSINTNDGIIDINLMLLVGYIRKSFVFILKFIIYCIIIDKYSVYIKKNDIYSEKFNINELYDQFNKFKFTHLLDFSKLFYKEALNRFTHKYPL